MSRKRLDPSTQEAPVLGAAVTMAVRDRVAELSDEWGTTRSAVLRDLIERGLGALDGGDGDGD